MGWKEGDSLRLKEFGNDCIDISVDVSIQPGDMFYKTHAHIYQVQLHYSL
jgi:hypothetical protein